MKRTNFILFALFLLLSTGQLWAQKQMPYKSAATFNGDTLRYLEYNYAIRNEQYKGKTVEVILKELEYPVLYVSGTCRSGLDNSNMISQLIALRFGIRQIGNEPSELEDYDITIFFENSPAFDEYKEVSEFSAENPFPVLSQKLYNFIKDLRISSVSSNSFLFKDPGNVKAWKERNRQVREKQFEDLKRAGMPEGEINKIRKRFKD